jgi:hypothetical protein
MRGLKRLIAACAASVLVSSAANAALVGHYLLDEAGGSTAIDSAGGDQNGTINGATYVTPGIQGGSALTFDATDDNVNLGASQDFIRNAAGTTLTAWITPTTTTGNRSIIGISGSTNAAQARAVVQLISDATTQNRLRIGGRRLNSDGFASVIAPAETALTAGQTYHVAGVIDYANETAALYINGVEVVAPTAINFSSVNGNSEDASNLAAFIGSRSDGTGEFFGGVIDDARIYNEALTGAQIAALVPEPGTMALAAGAAAMGLMRRRRKA